MPLLAVIIGAIVMAILSSLPVWGPLIAGFIAGLIAGGIGRGSLAGFLSGTIGGIIAVVVLAGVGGIFGAYWRGPREPLWADSREQYWVGASFFPCFTSVFLDSWAAPWEAFSNPKEGAVSNDSYAGNRFPARPGRGDNHGGDNARSLRTSFDLLLQGYCDNETTPRQREYV